MSKLELTIAEKINRESGYWLRYYRSCHEHDDADFSIGIAIHSARLLCPHTSAAETQLGWIKCKDCGAEVRSRYAGDDV